MFSFRQATSHCSQILAIEGSPNSNHLITASSSKTIITDKITYQEIDTLSGSSCIKSSHDGYLLYYTVNNQLLLCDKRFKSMKTLFESKEEINGLDLNQQGNTAGLTDDSGMVYFLDLRSLKATTVRSPHENIASPISFRATFLKQVVTGGFDSQIKIWDLDRVVEKASYRFLPEPLDAGCNPPHIHSLAWFTGGNVMAVGLGNGKIGLVSVARKPKSQPLIPRMISAHTWSVSSILVLNDEYMISGSIDQTVCLWKDEELKGRLKLGLKVNDMKTLSTDVIAVGTTASDLILLNMTSAYNWGG